MNSIGGADMPCSLGMVTVVALKFGSTLVHRSNKPVLTAILFCMAILWVSC